VNFLLEEGNDLAEMLPCCTIVESIQSKCSTSQIRSPTVSMRHNDGLNPVGSISWMYNTLFFASEQHKVSDTPNCAMF